MLKKILSIAGRPGLYKLISYGKNALIVESLIDGKRMPANSRERVISLNDISIFSDADDVPLATILTNVKDNFEGKPLDVANLKTPDQLHEFMAKVLPNYDRERVHNGDIKKIISWYNLLVKAGITDFSAKEEEPEQPADEKTEEGK